MFMRIDKLQAEVPEPKRPNPNAATALQELLGGKYGAFAPDYALEEMFEIATKLYQKSR